MKSQQSKRSFLSFVLSLAGSLVVCAGLLATLPEAAEFRLVFSPPDGSRLVYNINSTTNMMAQKDFLGRDISLDATAVGEINVFIKGLTPDSVLTSLTIPRIHIDVQHPDNWTQFDITTMETGPVQAVFSPWGRLKSIQNITSLNGQNKSNISLEQILRNFFPLYPREGLAIGESWVEHKRVVIPFQGIDLQVLIDETYFLDGVFPSFEGPIANISANYNVQLMGSKSFGDTVGTFEGQGSGTGILRVQIDGGYFTKFSINHHTIGSFVIRNGNTKLLDFPFDLTVTASTILTGKL